MAAASEAPLSARLRFSPFFGLQPACLILAIHPDKQSTLIHSVLLQMQHAVRSVYKFPQMEQARILQAGMLGCIMQ